MTLEIKQKALSFGIADTALASDLHDAAEKFKAWQEQNVRADKALYEVMEDAMAIGKTYPLGILKVAAKANNIATQKHSTAFGIAAKLVFRGLNNSTASTYGAVMEKADAAGIAPSGLADWIIEKKGISNIRNEDSDADKQKKAEDVAAEEARLARAKALVSGHYTTPLTLPALNPGVAEIQGYGKQRTTALLVKFNDAGDLDVIFSYGDEDVVELLYRKMGLAMDSVVKPRFSQVLAKGFEPKADEQDAAIDEAANAARVQPN
jgi:hypothetical protein